jgi:hypothetical protein
MLKTVAVAMTAFVVAASPAAHAQNAKNATVGVASSQDVDWKALTDTRIHVIKAALQLTPAQEKLWPAVEEAIRFRAQNRQERLAKIKERVEAMHDRGPGASLSDRNPVEFLNRRASALAQRSAGLKKLAEAWDPLYRTLDADQKGRMRFVTMLMLTEVRDAVNQARHDDESDDD